MSEKQQGRPATSGPTTNPVVADDTAPATSATVMQDGGPDGVSSVPRQRVALPGDPEEARRQHRLGVAHRQARISRELDRLCGVDQLAAGAATKQIDYHTTAQDVGWRERAALADLAAVVAERMAALELALADLEAARRWAA